MTTLTRSSDNSTITLPDDMVWRDEFAWSPVVQQQQYTLTGALIIEEAKRLAGRPITLGGDEQGPVWADRSTVIALYGWADDTATQMQLTLTDGRPFDVHFRYDGKGPIQTTPVVARVPAHADDPYTLTLSFIEVGQ